MNSSSGITFLGLKSYIALKVKALRYLLIGKKLLPLDLCMPREHSAKFTVSESFQHSYQISQLYL